jgi:hypothetical protein
MNPDRNPARKCVVLGAKCDSQLEGRRWLELSALANTGQILNLRHHPRYPLIVQREAAGPGGTLPKDTTLVCTYEADAEYDVPVIGQDARNEKCWVRHVVEDTKGRRSGPAWSLFRVKSKLFRALYGYDIEVWPPETKKPRRKHARITKA